MHVFVSAKAKLILGRVLVGAAGLSLLSFIELYIYLDYTRPHTADAAAGRLIPLNNHGSIAYLTYREHQFLYALAWAAGIFVVAAILLRGRHRLK